MHNKLNHHWLLRTNDWFEVNVNADLLQTNMSCYDVLCKLNKNLKLNVITGLNFSLFRIHHHSISSVQSLISLLHLSMPYFTCIKYCVTLHHAFTHLPLDKMAAISQTIFSDAFSWTKNFVFRFEFHWSLFTRVQLTIFQHWPRQWLGAE